MKKLFVISNILIAVLLLLTACGNSEVNEFEKFVNTQIPQIESVYKDITAEIGKWVNLESDDEWAASINTLIPKCDEALEMLSKIDSDSEEITAVKTRFVKAIELYKEAFVQILEAIEKADEEIMLKGDAKLAESLDAYDEYLSALEDLTAQLGSAVKD